MYNLTNFTNANNIYEQAAAMNSLSGGLIGIFTLVGLFLILFVAFKKTEHDTKETLLVTSTITTIVGILMWTAQLIGFNIVVYPIIALFASIMIYKFTD